LTLTGGGGEGTLVSSRRLGLITRVGDILSDKERLRRLKKEK